MTYIAAASLVERISMSDAFACRGSVMVKEGTLDIGR
jgi:hypothetical protein